MRCGLALDAADNCGSEATILLGGSEGAWLARTIESFERSYGRTKKESFTRAMKGLPSRVEHIVVPVNI